MQPADSDLDKICGAGISQPRGRVHWSEVEQLEQNNKFLSKYLKYFYYEEGGCGGDHLFIHQSGRKRKFLKIVFSFY